MISSDSTQEEEAVRVFEVVHSEEEDFEVYNQPNPVDSPTISLQHLPSTHISSNQETTNVPKAIVLQCKNTSLLELLESHAGRSMPKVFIPLRAHLLFLVVPLLPNLQKRREREKRKART